MKKKSSKVVVVMPAYNAAKTIAKTVGELPKGLVDEIIVVDDHSGDDTVNVARKLGLTVFEHPRNLGYGGNQKTCYREALKKNPDVVVMVHPDYQYDAKLLPDLVNPILNNTYDFMFGNRIHSRREALDGGMPKRKYFFNRVFTMLANTILGLNHPEYLSGLRAYSAKALQLVPFQRFSNDFVFDQQFMFSAISFGLRIGSIPIPTRYYNDSSSIQWWPGVKFGL
ncbi:glycosyltransferase family 2 protein, partial [Candidatus Jorgensenbacteria bacterium]|nr:glycosyltransferase family 2 protein [Candidatus Jorgensenbacteria bacterium]